jgi:hypothetical protein
MFGLRKSRAVMSPAFGEGRLKEAPGDCRRIASRFQSGV